LQTVAVALGENTSVTVKALVATVDCSDEAWTDRCLDLGINSWPTIRIFGPDAESVRYRGPRDAAA
jgi:hypothetical protein